jgi:hypothetical protein
MDKLQTFVVWLDGYIEAVGEDGFNISKTNVIKNRLFNLFEHVADKIEEPVKEAPEPDVSTGQNGPKVSDLTYQGGGRIYRC